MSLWDVLNRSARGLHVVSHRRSFEECGTAICTDARLVLAGLGEGADHRRSEAGLCEADADVWPCSYEQARRFREFGGH